MNKEYLEIKQLHNKFGFPISETPVSLTEERAEERYGMLLEKINEFLEIAKDQVLDKGDDPFYMFSHAYNTIKEFDITSQAEALIDTIYLALGTLVEMGVNPDILFRIVQHANMSKLWEDGKPHYNEMGKVIKPAGWEDPHSKLQVAVDKMKDGLQIEPYSEDYMLEYQYKEVRNFHLAFNHPVASNPTLLTVDRAEARHSWMLEEINEFLDAVKKQDIVEQADAMIDTIYFALGTLVEMGINPQELFDIVHNANMRKILSDGQLKYANSDDAFNTTQKLLLTVRKMYK